MATEKPSKVAVAALLVSVVFSILTMTITTIGIQRSARADEVVDLRDRVANLERQLDECKDENLRLMKKILNINGSDSL